MAIDLMLSVIFFGRKWEMRVEFLDVSPNKLFPITFLGHYLHLFRTSTDSHSHQLQVGPTCAMSCCFIASEGWLKNSTQIFWADSRNSRMNEYLQISNIYNYNLFLNMNKSMVLCQKEIRPPKKNPTKMCQTPFLSHLRLCRGLGLRPGQGVFFGFAAHLPTRSRAMTCRWIVVAPGPGAQNALKIGIFWNRKGGTFEKPNSKAENHHLFLFHISTAVIIFYNSSGKSLHCSRGM